MDVTKCNVYDDDIIKTGFI